MNVVLQTGPNRLDFLIGSERFTSYLSHTERPGFDLLTAPGRRAVTQGLDRSGVTVTVGHGNVDGVSFLSGIGDAEPTGTQGRIVSEEIAARRGSASAGFRQHCAWLGPADRRMVSETRTVRVFPGGGEGRVVDLAIQMMTPERIPVMLNPSEAGLLCIRCAPSLCAAGGGQLRNSAGEYGPDAVHGLSATWCAAVGVVQSETVGMVILDHPDNPGHPARWCARADGLISPSVSGWRTVEILPGRGLMFRYRIHIHRGYVDQGWGDARLEDYLRDERS